MCLRVGEVDGGGLACHQADQAFVGAHHGAVHRIAVEAFGGIQLKCQIDAQHIDGAHLRNHIGGDQHHDLVKAFLRADRLRHDFAKPAQQHARTAERATHDVRSLGLSSTGGAARIAPASSKMESPRFNARGEHPHGYIECGMQTASQRRGYDGGGICAPQREPVIPSLGERNGALNRKSDVA